jgi:alginate O-acetyltransferase complex protein AlgI
MIGTGAFWLILLTGAAWTAWGPARWREPGLALLAAALVGWHDPGALLVYLGLTVLVWRLVRGGRSARGVNAAVAALAVGLAGCKWLQAISSGDGVAGPLGLSYLVFRLIHVLIEAGRGQLPPSRGWAEFAHYAFCPGIFAAGPLERWEHFTAERRERVDGTLAAEALQRLAVGLCKKLVLADAVLLNVAASLGVADPTSFTPATPPATLWLGALLCYLKIYAEFSGYSDIAVGAGLLWGRRIMENFNWPVLATTPADFWRRWHISLSQWCARYVYMPLLGAWRGTAAPMLGSFLVMGLWHLIGWNRVGWAVWQTAGVLVQSGWCRLAGRARPGTWRVRWPWRLASCLLTQIFVIASYTFIMAGEDRSLSASLGWLAQMFGL